MHTLSPHPITISRIKLRAPQLQEHHIKERITCIRGHRERMHKVACERISGRLIVHNYGHGGAGWTFLFGCVQDAIMHFKAALAQDPTLHNQPITIIGAGCYGLLTALMLHQEGYAVQIVAQELIDIPSRKAAGFFFPRPRKVSNEQESALFLKHGIASYRTYQTIIDGHHPFIKRGPKLLPAYFGMDIDPGFAPYCEIGLIPPPEHVMIDFTAKEYEAMRYQLIYLNPADMMQELWQQIISARIPLMQRTVNSFHELPTPIIFNCAGLGAQALTHDPKMVPVQGHLITLQDQPPMEELQYMINFKVIQQSERGPRYELIYYAPKDEGILGITFMRGPKAIQPNDHEFDRLLQRSRDFFGN